MPDYSDALSVHFDSVTSDARAFSLIMDKDGWVASVTRKHARKAVTGTGDTAIEAIANLLTTLRGSEDEGVADDAPETFVSEPEVVEAAEPTDPGEPSLRD